MNVLHRGHQNVPGFPFTGRSRCPHRGQGLPHQLPILILTARGDFPLDFGEFLDFPRRIPVASR